MSIHLSDPSEIKILKALLSKKSPTRILDLLPQRKFAVFFPLHLGGRSCFDCLRRQVGWNDATNGIGSGSGSMPLNPCDSVVHYPYYLGHLVSGAVQCTDNCPLMSWPDSAQVPGAVADSVHLGEATVH